MFFHLRSNAIKSCAFGLWFVLVNHVACGAIQDESQAPSIDSSAADPGSVGGGGSGGSAITDVVEEDDVEFDTGTPTEGPETCAQTGSEANPVQLDIVVLLDRSGSMYGANWNGVTKALKEFVQDPASSGIRVGILYFPIDAPADAFVCNPLHYQTLSVPLDLLPQNAAAMVGSIDSQSPNGGSTPMHGALEGTLWAAAQEQMSQPNHKVIVVFASDGDPNSCPNQQNNISVIAQLVKTAYEASSVETYVIAINGASIVNLDQIAAAGGTGTAYDVTGNVNQFAQKMEEIRIAALACEYVIPPPPGDEPFELDKVVVKHVADDGTLTEIPRATSEIDCGQLPGWYYDDPVAPKKIKLCPASCDVARQDKQGRIDVFFGCKPIIN